jgi:hypothetical protein
LVFFRLSFERVFLPGMTENNYRPYTGDYQSHN